MGSGMGSLSDFSYILQIVSCECLSGDARLISTPDALQLNSRRPRRMTQSERKFSRLNRTDVHETSSIHVNNLPNTNNRPGSFSNL